MKAIVQQSAIFEVVAEQRAHLAKPDVGIRAPGADEICHRGADEPPCSQIVEKSICPRSATVLALPCPEDF
jgi:hypothetical protein